MVSKEVLLYLLFEGVGVRLKTEEERVQNLIHWFYSHNSPKGEELHIKWIDAQENRDQVYAADCRSLYEEYVKLCDI